MDRNKKIEELFFAALELDPSERDAFLTRNCSNDPSLGQEVRSLLNAHGKAFDIPDEPAWSMFVDRPDEEEGTDAAALEPEPGLPFDRLGEFRLIRKLGEGGMGMVYLAVQEPLGRKVALKIIRPERMGSLEAETRFSREAKAVSRLRHPNIVTVYGGGKEKGVHYFAMEFVEGKGLEELLHKASSKGETKPLPKVLGWIREIAQALGSGHETGIIHRDVKPSNIRITPGGQALLMDYGVARHTNLATMTLTGDFRGTPHYASPEQVKAKSQAIDARTDVYSLGVTLYEAVTGKVPFRGETTEQVFHQILEIDPVSPRRLNPAISRDLENVITTAMEKDPNQRYPSMAVFAADLGRLLAGEAVWARPAGWIRGSTKWMRRHRFLTFAAATVLIVLSALTFFGLEISRQKQKEFRVAAERFKPVNKVITRWTLFLPWPWCSEIDPHDPGACMLKAIFEIESNELEQAVCDLEECIKRCKGCGENNLEKDAHYLLGITRLALSERPESTRQEKEKLRDDAEFNLRKTGDFDPAAGETFVWQERDLLEMAPGRAGDALSNIKINSEHFLVQLDRGLQIFPGLFLGGGIEDFEKTINSFEAVLSCRHDHVISWTYLGRTYYFFARFFDFLDMAEKAEECLVQALRFAGDRPSYMIYNTLGAVSLLRGRNDEALAYNEEARKIVQHHRYQNMHNIYSGIGKAYARQGLFNEALEQYELALKIHPGDASVRMALAELFLFEGDLDRAQKQVQYLVDHGKEIRAVKISGVLHPALFLIRTRIHLERKEYPEAENCLYDLYTKAIFSSRDFSLACLLIATFPEDRLCKEDGKQSELGSLAKNLKFEAHFNTRYHFRTPPILLSADGVCMYLSGDYQDAIQNFEKAIQEREKWWPREIREFHWIEDARDLYLKAMTYFKLSLESKEPKIIERKARACFDEAEKLYLHKSFPIESIDIIRRFRTKAKEVLGIY